VVTEAPAVHSLLRITTPAALSWEDDSSDGTPPDWTDSALQRLPFVVVRRNPPRAGSIAVGIRGIFRSQRAPAWLPSTAVQACVTPRMLARQCGWCRADYSKSPAVAVLNQVEMILTAQGFAGSWGPGGSVGAELASGVKCASPTSDLDLVLYADSVLEKRAAQALHAELSALPVRVDVLLEVPQGGVALADFVSDADRLLMRTAQGPRLVRDPWNVHAPVPAPAPLAEMSACPA
jgi:phosphoribosyl-dephospho-CoA transferase